MGGYRIEIVPLDADGLWWTWAAYDDTGAIADGYAGSLRVGLRRAAKAVRQFREHR